MKKMIIVCCILAVLSCLFIGVYFMFNGTPWGEDSAKKKIRAYLENKYEQEMVIDWIWYDFKMENYVGEVSPAEQENLSFSVIPINSPPQYKDDYFITKWQDEIYSELKPFIQRTFENVGSGYIDIDENPIYDEYSFVKGEIPSYNEVRSKLKDSVKVYIRIARDFDDSNSNDERQKMFDIINFIKEKNYEPGKVTFAFINDDNDREESVHYRIRTLQDLMSIQSKEDIEKYKD